MRNRKLCILYTICILINNAHSEDLTLKCDESMPIEPFCTVSSFVVSHSQNVKIQTNGKTNMTKFMKFYASRLLYVPYKLFDVFSNLKTLDVSFTEIIDIPRNTFGAANYLTYLNMSHNNISSINTSVFAGANNLIRLDLSHNHITEMSEYAFRGLNSLDKLQLSYNQITTLGKDIFLENPYVETIYLDNNLLEYIDPEVFNRSRRIREVSLSHNRLLHMHPATFHSAYMLEILLLDYNQLNEFLLDNKSINTQLVLDNNNLTSVCINGTKYVSAENNRLTMLQMTNSKFLESLQLKNNSIRDIRNITNVTELLYLDLSQNPIAPINITTFDRLRWLWSLRLSGTGIRHLEFGMFSKFNKLELLDLSHNNMTELNLDVFVPYLATLKELYVDGNQLSEVEGKHTFSTAFPNLQKLGISKNNFNCTYLHTLLTTPSLSSAVELHIEPNLNVEESSHIRDISCQSMRVGKVSSVQAKLETSKKDDNQHEILQQLQEHAHRLEVYLILLKVALIIFVNLTLILLVLQLWKFKRRNYFVSRGDSILFRSEAASNTNIEHHL